MDAFYDYLKIEGEEPLTFFCTRNPQLLYTDITVVAEYSLGFFQRKESWQFELREWYLIIYETGISYKWIELRLKVKL